MKNLLKVLKKKIKLYLYNKANKFIIKYENINQVIFIERHNVIKVNQKFIITHLINSNIDEKDIIFNCKQKLLHNIIKYVDYKIYNDYINPNDRIIELNLLILKKKK